ncbi:SGNH/GDSL hydrolase family protein [Rubrivirga sp.]|uniref:SGNH/GDSL hydrolase family protein n=1 Tax=Rubrivirga sp. TaxID=1885344 RepID=UPI003B52A55A
MPILARLAAFVLVLAGPALAQDPTPIRVAVLGDSNSAGAGPSDRDDVWVNRLRRHLEATRPGSTVFNYAVNGYTTYNAVPTNRNPPPNRPPPDPSRNVSAALRTGPDVIVIAMTSNDANRGYGVAEQLANYDAIVAAAGETPVFVATTTPRNSFRQIDTVSVETRMGYQIAMRDSTLARWGRLAIDFWTPLATPDDRLSPDYDVGDGVHFNAEAHRLLFEAVVASALVSVALPTDGGPGAGLSVVPLPHPSPAALAVRVDRVGPVRVEMFDARGRLVATLADDVWAPGERRLPLPRLAPGLYLARLSQDGRQRTATVAVAR